MTLAERIRQFAFENYVAPMRDRPNAEIRIRAGDVHKGMGLGGRMPAVCGALDATIFRREYGLELARRAGPAQGANVEYVFRVKGAEPTPLQLSTENDTAPRQPRIRFTLRGKTFEKESHDFIEAIAGQLPSRIQTYSTTINGRRYPIRQVVACATGLPAIAITSQDAYRILERFGFAIETQDGANAGTGGQVSAKSGAEASIGEPETQTHSISMKIDLLPETEASLAARAAAEGISLPEYVARRLREEVTQDVANTLAPAERAAAWREAAKGLPRTPPLSDEAISRESIYSARG
jgi:predicted HicB family RNase H-like nuclease